MDRREFLKDAAGMILVLPFGTFLVQCGSEDKEVAPTQPDDQPPAAAPRLENGNIVYASNKVLTHSHNFQVPTDAIQTPPEDGVVGDTTEAQGHSHSLELTQAALTMAGSGQAIKIITASAKGHAHTFTIQKIV